MLGALHGVAAGERWAVSEALPPPQGHCPRLVGDPGDRGTPPPRTGVVAGDAGGAAENLPEQGGVLLAVLNEDVLQRLRPVQLVEDDGGCKAQSGRLGDRDSAVSLLPLTPEEPRGAWQPSPRPPCCPLRDSALGGDGHHRGVTPLSANASWDRASPGARDSQQWATHGPCSAFPLAPAPDAEAIKKPAN